MTTQRFFKIIYTGSLSLVFLWIFVAIVRHFIPLEIVNPRFVDTYYTFRFYGLPIAILLTLSGTINKTQNAKEIGSRITITAAISALSFFMLIIGLFLGMCACYNPKVHYIKKDDNSVKIVERSYGCGAYDSGPPIRKCFKVIELTSFLNWTTEINLKEINKPEWTEVTAP